MSRPVRSLIAKVMLMAIALCPKPHALASGPPHSGAMTHDNVLLGIHFLHERADCNTTGAGILNVAPSFWDYTEKMPEDLKRISYADFWHWWYEFERYKGDEKGMAEMDAIVDECLRRGMKVKIDLSWSTPYTNDRDWPKDTNLVLGPVDADDWMHLCDLLGRRYRGRVALWLLQGEANTRDYWPGMDIKHVQEIYRTGYDAFKRADPGTFISISGATPGIGGMNVYGALNNRDQMDRWTRDNLTACKGKYDDVPMNYFADVFGADPYAGLKDYFTSIRSVLDELGQRQVEVGSGESSFQWALDSRQVKAAPPPWKPDPAPHPQPPLSEEGQAWRFNRSMAEFFGLGGSKFMFWASEFAPGGGWVWRWGLRKYQDWWDIWPAKHKVPGTNIVFGSETDDGAVIDLRPGWTSAQADPYHPIWSVYRFWAQASPPGAEAVRLPARFAAEPRAKAPGLLATYLRCRDEAVALVQLDQPGPTTVLLDLAATGWVAGTPLEVRTQGAGIDYRTGAETPGPVRRTPVVAASSLRLPVSTGAPFTTVRIVRARPAIDGAIALPDAPAECGVGEIASVAATVTNTGTAAWTAGCVDIRIGGRTLWTLRDDLVPGASTADLLRLPRAACAGQTAHLLRLAHAKGRAFGPATVAVVRAVELQAPRKLVAHREVGRIRVQWFAPEGGVADRYVLMRADAFGGKATAVATTRATMVLDTPPLRDHAYWYHVVALDARGRRSRPSNEDNAKAISKPRLWDAEVTASAPARMRLGEQAELEITIRNTGSQAWDTAAQAYRLHLALTRQWDAAKESRIDLPAGPPVPPGGSVKLRLPYATHRPGRFENHWAFAMEVPGKAVVHLGTPLLAETVVTE